MSTTAHFPDSDNFQRQADEFISWLDGSLGVRINPKIRVADLRSQDAGRGVGMSLVFSEIILCLFWLLFPFPLFVKCVYKVPL